MRQISIPTTLSAGEFSGIAGVTNEATRVKELFRHPLTIPQAVILDPEVTRHTPMWLFLSTGIRAVDHCVEGVCSNESTEFTNASALHGLALLTRGLPRVKADPADMRARLDCQIGSWLSMGALAAGVPMGASHGIGYVLGAVFDVPHGHTSCIMLPWVMRWNKSANADRQALIANAMGHPGKDAGDVLDDFIRRPRHAAQPGRGEDRQGALRPHRRTGHGHALGAAQSAQDRRAGAGEGDIGAGGLGWLLASRGVCAVSAISATPCALVARADVHALPAEIGLSGISGISDRERGGGRRKARAPTDWGLVHQRRAHEVRRAPAGTRAAIRHGDNE